MYIVSKGTTAHSYKEQLQLWGTTAHSYKEQLQLRGTTAHSYKEQLQLWGTTETPKGTTVALEEKAIATAEERTAGVPRGDL